MMDDEIGSNVSMQLVEHCLSVLIGGGGGAGEIYC